MKYKCNHCGEQLNTTCTRTECDIALVDGKDYCQECRKRLVTQFLSWDDIIEQE